MPCVVIWGKGVSSANLGDASPLGMSASASTIRLRQAIILIACQELIEGTLSLESGDQRSKVCVKFG